MKKLLFVLLSLLAVSVFAESRNALLIANAKYQNFGSLATPVKEARDLKKTLETLGFSVTIVENASLEQMQEAVDSFGTKLQKQGGIGFFHYGGHAVQVNGVNYLIPVNADIPDEKKVKIRPLCVDEITTSMNADTNIIVLDACRNNPLPASSGRSASRGLVLSVEHPKNSIIIYSAQPNNVAQDGVFTPILTKCLLEKKELGAVLRDVRREVANMTDGKQNPGEYNELTSEVYLAGYETTTHIIQQTPTVVKQQKPNAKAEKLFNKGKEAEDKGDFKTALQYYEKAAKQEYADAQTALGIMYYGGDGVTQDYIKAKEWFEKAANQGDVYAQNWLGDIYGIKQDYTKAIYWYEKAANQGYAEAQGNLGWLYYHGYGVSQNYTKAKEWFEKAAAQDNKYSQYWLGNMYYNGEGVPQDYTKAKEWYEKAANQDYAQAQYALGILYYKGEGVKQDYAKTQYWYEKAAAQGYAVAQCNLGSLYYNGEGVPQDYTKAKELFEKAAIQGDSDAQCNLGWLYYNGERVPQDYTKAKELFEMAANQDNAIAQNNLGYMYYYGKGVSKDYTKAKYWYEKAAAQGIETAIEALKKLK